MPNHLNIVFQKGLQLCLSCSPLSILVPCHQWDSNQSRSGNNVVISPTLTWRPQELMWWKPRIVRTWHITSRTLWSHQLGGGHIDAPLGINSHQIRCPYKPCLRISDNSWWIFPLVGLVLWQSIWLWKVEGRSWKDWHFHQSWEEFGCGSVCSWRLCGD